MRLDKFLKLSHLVKRRTVAQEMLEVGAIKLNGRVVKPSKEVKEDDVVEIGYAKKILTIKVITADEFLLKRKTEAYEVMSEKLVEVNI
ncbi:MAG: S4 domain-containing protein [Synergistaceae bacterium]|nr:S4 domain-containing protein [Synergistaceae bacterium]